MNLTEKITSHILELFQQETDNPNNAEGTKILIRRKDLAERFECVPSQINYVLRSRFNPQRGYLVTSQRGGNGYIQIRKCSYQNHQDKLEHLESIIGNEPSRIELERSIQLCSELGYLSHRERLLIEIALHHLEDLMTSGAFDLPPYRRQQILVEQVRRFLHGVMGS